MHYRQVCAIPSQFCLKQNEPIWVSITDISNNPHLKRITSEHSYSKKKPPGPHDLASQVLPQFVTRTLEKSVASHTIQQCAVDGVSQYASAVLNGGL